MDRKTLRQIMLLIAFTVVLMTASMYVSQIFSAVAAAAAVLSPVVIGLCMAFVLNIPLSLFENRLFAPLNRRFTKRWPKIRRAVSIVLSVAAVAALITVVAVTVIPTLADTVKLISADFPTYMEKAESWLSGVLGSLGVGADLSGLEIDWSKIGEYLTNLADSYSERFFSATFGVTSKVITGAVDAVLAFVFALYVLASKEKVGEGVQRLMKAFLSPNLQDGINHVSSVAYNSFYHFITGQCVEAVILGLLCWIGMLILRFPYAALISVLIGFTALIPMVGAFIGAAVGAFLILTQSPLKALWFIIFVICLQQVEGNLIYPKVVGKSIGLPGFWVLFAVTVGGGLGGIAGILAGVPLASALYALAGEALAAKEK